MRDEKLKGYTLAPSVPHDRDDTVIRDLDSYNLKSAEGNNNSQISNPEIKAIFTGIFITDSKKNPFSYQEVVDVTDTVIKETAEFMKALQDNKVQVRLDSGEYELKLTKI